MGISEAFQDAIGILKLDGKSVMDAARGPFLNPVLIFVVVAIVNAIAALIWMDGGFFGILIGSFVGLFIGSFIGVFLIWIFAKLFGGQGDYMDQYKPQADSMLLNVLQIIPIIGGLVAGIWSIVAAVKIVQVVHKLTTGKAVAAVLIPVVIIGAILVALMLAAAVALAGFMGGMMGGLA